MKDSRNDSPRKPAPPALPALLAGVLGASLGAGMIYFLDPVSGHRRRARFSDKAVHVFREAGHALDRVASDLSGRAQGQAARLGNFLRTRAVDDEILGERVRSKVGHFVTHPRDVHIEIRDGVLTLRGSLPASEAGRLVYHARWIAGVMGVRNRITERTG